MTAITGKFPSAPQLPLLVNIALSRNIDFSQNVHRAADTTKTGIIGCCTPNGIPFNTARGGIVLGLECLRVQGIPVEQLELSQLSDTQLRDLAGNAMSSTVITTTMLAALTVFYKVLKLEGREKVVEQPLVPSMDKEATLERKSSDPASYPQKSVSELTELASRSSRLCYCEGRHEKLNTGFRQCKLCKHTACIKCGVNPRHDYQPFDQWVIDSRISPAEAEVLLKASIPKKISFANAFDMDDYLQKFQATYKHVGMSDETIALIVEALKSELRFKGIRRREAWNIEFRSSAAKLFLTISHFGVQWQLFAKVPEKFEGNHPARRFFEKYPVAQMTPSEEVITDGQWNFWVPKPEKFSATIISSGSRVESFHSKIGLEPGSSVWNNLNIAIKYGDGSDHYFPQDLNGDYKYGPDCAQAFDSMHVKDEVKPFSAPLCLFYDHEGQTGDPKNHSFVFSNDHYRKDSKEPRRTYARLDPSWRQHVVESDNEAKHIAETTIIVDGYWTQLKGFAIAPSQNLQFEYNHLPSHLSTHQLSCESLLAALTCELAINNSDVAVPMDKWIEVGRANEKLFFQEFGWVLENGKVMTGHSFRNLEHVDQWHRIIDDDRCRTNRCAPEAPPILWSYETKVKGSRKPKQKPFEDPVAATTFENALKLRPSGISIFYRASHETLEVKVGINPKTLCHRALAALKPKGQTQTSFCFVTDDTFSKARCDPFVLMSTQNEELAPQPAGFLNGLTLRPEQQKKLAWMIKQEFGVRFTEREFVEARFEQVGYLLMGQVSQERTVRGGILADEVGFGKTVVILALVLICLEADKKFARQPWPGRIPIKATIIFVPGQLPKQWKTEAEKFLPGTPKETILVIETVKQLGKLTVKDFKEAMLIVVSSSLCQSPVYQHALAHLTAMVEPAATASHRAKAAWNKTARELVGSTVKCLLKNPAGLKPCLDSQFEANLKTAMAKDLPIPSKRITGAKYQELSRKRNFDEFHTEGLSSGQDLNDHFDPLIERKDVHNFKNLEELGCDALTFPIFEMFAYARLVVDEFTYVKILECNTMMHLDANSRWALSGTCPTDDFAGVKTMAQFLDVYLGADDFSHMKRDVYAKAVMEMTGKNCQATFAIPLMITILQLLKSSGRTRVSHLHEWKSEDMTKRQNF
jgi:hypothetical protein